jgi:hypothetical protein
MKIKCFFLIIPFFLSPIIFAQYINKSFLKYNRNNAIQYASENWHRINTRDGYINFGGQFDDTYVIPNQTYRDCRSYGLTVTCGGDCANFASQCLLAGGISEFDLIQGVDPNSISFGQSHKTIANAEDLGERLIAMGASRITSYNDLKEGDFIDVLQSSGDCCHAMLANNSGANVADIRVWGHSPIANAEHHHSGFPCPDFDGDLARYNLTNIRLIHIPDVTMVSSVKIYRKEAGKDNVYYQATFNENSGADGSIEISKNMPISKYQNDEPYYIEVTFNKKIVSTVHIPIVKIINGEITKSIQFAHRIPGITSTEMVPTATVSIDPLYKSFDLEDVTNSRVLSSERNIKRLFKFQPKDDDLIGDRDRWFLKIEGAVSAMDDTPMNGWGDYSLYFNGPDTNHKINILTPEIVFIGLKDREKCKDGLAPGSFVVSSFPNGIAGGRVEKEAFQYTTLNFIKKPEGVEGSTCVDAIIKIKLPGVKDVTIANSILSQSDLKFLTRNYEETFTTRMELEKTSKDADCDEYNIRYELPHLLNEGTDTFKVYLNKLPNEAALEEAKHYKRYGEISYTVDFNGPSITYQDTKGSSDCDMLHILWGNAPSTSSDLYQVFVCWNPGKDIKTCIGEWDDLFLNPKNLSFQIGLFSDLKKTFVIKAIDFAGNETFYNETASFTSKKVLPHCFEDGIEKISTQIIPPDDPDYKCENKSTCDICDDDIYCEKPILINSPPEITNISFSKTAKDNESILTTLKENKLTIEWNDPDESKATVRDYKAGSLNAGIDYENCVVTDTLTNLELYNQDNLKDEKDKATGFEYLYDIDDSALTEGDFYILTSLNDKLGLASKNATIVTDPNITSKMKFNGSQKLVSKKFTFNPGPPEIEIFNVSTSFANVTNQDIVTISGQIKDIGTLLKDLEIIIYTGVEKTLKTDPDLVRNSLNLTCITEKLKNSPNFQYNENTGDFSFQIAYSHRARIPNIHVNIKVYDRNCNHAEKDFNYEPKTGISNITDSNSTNIPVLPTTTVTTIAPRISVSGYSAASLSAVGTIVDADSRLGTLSINVSTLKDSLSSRTAAVINPSGCNCSGFNSMVDPASTVTYSNLSGSGSTVTGNSSNSSSNCLFSSGLFELSEKASKPVSGSGGGIFTLGPAWGGCTSLALQRGKEIPGETPTQISIPSGFTAGDEIKFDYSEQTGAFSLQAHPNSFSRTLKVTISAYDESCNHASQSVDFFFSGLGFQGLESPFWENETSTEIPTEYPVVNGNLPYGQVILNYINRVYDASSGKNEFNLYEPDYTRTELYINGSQVNSFLLYDQLNIQAKANIDADKLYYYSLFSGLWTLESPGFSFIFNAIVQIFDAFFPDSEANSWQKIIPQEYYPRITKYQKIEYYYDNRLVLWGAYVPDHLTYIPIRPLPEGWNNARSVIYDYEGNKSETFFKFNVVYKPLIFDFKYSEFTSGSPEKSSITASIRDYGDNVDISGIRLILDGIEIPIGQLNFKWDGDQYRGSIKYYLPMEMPDGEHTAILEVSDLNGNKDRKEIVFSTSFIKLILDRVEYRDIEGNGDGIINEGERIYIDLNLKNTGKVTAEEVKAELLNKSRYIKGVPEPKADYGKLPFNFSVINNKPYEFVVENQIFAQVDVEKVYAEFILHVTYQITSGENKIERTAELPFTVPIEKLDPAFADFRIWLNSSIKETLNPNYTLRGGWYINGTFVEGIKAENYSGSSVIPVEIVRDDINQTFTGNAALTPGDNRFVVTATADNGIVRTAEVSVKLLSQVGIKLDSIADTREPNVAVTGEAWTVNSKLENVKIYVNGGLIGDAAVDSGGRFSLPVTLNGGENIIRAVARDDQGKSAMDEIKINMHGPLTIRWERAHSRVNETPIRACGSYEVEGDDIASIVTYVNNTPNTYEVVIDRNLKTFCTKADLQNGNNILRAVGTTTGGVTADAFSRVEYGGLSVSFDPVPEVVYTSTVTITGSFTLTNIDPYNIQIEVTDCESGVLYYTPTIDPIAHTFTTTITLHDPIIPPWAGPCHFGDPCPHTIIATINQAGSNADDLVEITRLQSSQVYGVETTSVYMCCGDSTGWIEGRFLLDSPSVHITSIRYHMYYCSGSDEWHDVTIWDEISETWHLDFDSTPESPSRFYDVELTDNFGHTTICSGETTWCEWKEGDPIPFDPNKVKNIKKVRPNEKRKHKPKRAVDGGRD